MFRGSNTCGDSFRQLRCELLERREMLSVNAPEAIGAPYEADIVPAAIAPAIDNSLAGRDQSLAISAVHLLVDGEAVSVNSLDQIVQLNVGSTFEVVGIEYRLNGEESVEGRIAFEAYQNKLRGSDVFTDYSDGLFGGHEQQGELPFGSASHSGLDGEWTLEAGTESVTLVMVRYGADGVAVEDRVNIRTQVGTPDFVMFPRVVVRASSQGVVVGEQVQLFGAWGNIGQGTFRNYAEVDIYHESDPNKIVWSGAFDDVTFAGDFDAGEFLNKNKANGFSQQWIPELGGTYTLKFYVDPENLWNESNEDNNVSTATLEVQDLRQVDRGTDALLGRGANQHSFADEAPSRGIAANEAVLAAAAAQVNRAANAAALPQSNVDSRTTSEGQQVVVEFNFAQSSVSQSNSIETPANDTLTHRESEIREDDWLEALDQALGSLEG